MSESRIAPGRAEPLFAVAIGLSAFLLFTLQFLIGKKLLPWFGGVPAVWATCLLFFQVGLLLGYLYAHLVSTALTPRRQRDVHLSLLALALAVLAVHAVSWPSPLTPSDAWKPGPTDEPAGRLLGLLAASVGLPFFALSATTPLLSSWFARVAPGRPPWRLYALSNLGSLLGLLAYPLLLEPNLALPGQGRLVAGGFGVFALVAAAAAVAFARPAVAAGVVPPPKEPALTPGRAPGALRTLTWFVLAAVPSLLLLAVTNQVTLEIAVIPLLWVLPLALYLFSFVVCFQFPRLYHRAIFLPLAALSAGLATWTLEMGPDVSIATQAGICALVLFAFAMACHGELVRLTPAAVHLTRFYLAVSAGGAAGGLFVSLAAPRLFPALWELPIGLVLGTLLLAATVLRDERTWLYRGRFRAPVFLVLSAAGILTLAWVLAEDAHEELDGTLRTSRNFFGVFKVLREAYPPPQGLARSLKHGRISHGLQFETAPYSSRPTTYYGELSGAGLALRHHPKRVLDPGAPLRVGVVGLGTGSLAVYARPGDVWRFYEINPDVAALSSGRTPMFTYLADAAADVRVVLGDARLSLEAEPPQRFDFLAIDAFSSDAIPLHLMTREAFALYGRHLSPDGILAVHISNRFLDLTPVVRRLARELGLSVALFLSPREGLVVWPARWMLLSKEKGAFDRPPFAAFADPLESERDPGPLFTDDYSNLLRAIRW